MSVYYVTCVRAYGFQMRQSDPLEWQEAEATQCGSWELSLSLLEEDYMLLNHGATSSAPQDSLT